VNNQEDDRLQFYPVCEDLFSCILMLQRKLWDPAGCTRSKMKGSGQFYEILRRGANFVDTRDVL
jgi:hypothetical protein